MSESKPNWVDKANLASNVLQNVQLNELQSTMRVLGAVQAERARLELNEQQTKDREDRIREHIWQLENGFGGLLRDASVTPSALYIMTKQIQDGMARFRITTSSFRQFADKDRLGDFLKRIQQAMDDSTAKMSTQDRHKVETYLRYQSETLDLAALIRRLKADSEKLITAKEQRDAAASKLEGLKHRINTPDGQREQASRRWERLLATGGLIVVAAPTGVAWLSLAFLFGVPVYDLLDSGNTQGDGGIFGIGVVVLLFAIGGSVLCRFLHLKSIAIKPISEQIATLEKKIKDGDARIAKLSEPLAGEGELLKYQANNLSELLQQQQERETFIRQFRQANGFPPDDPQLVVEPDSATLSPEVQELARYASKKISAIQLHQKQTGASLAAAKEAVEKYFLSRGDGSNLS
jgi:hypothetical protein